jgi:hypothetical protein
MLCLCIKYLDLIQKKHRQEFQETPKETLNFLLMTVARVVQIPVPISSSTVLQFAEHGGLCQIRGSKQITLWYHSGLRHFALIDSTVVQISV